MDVSVDRVRNVVLVGHNGNGKTTVAEALLLHAGITGHMGSVDDGTTVADSDPEEHERRQSLSLAVLPFDWDGHRINLIDTPGYVDFTGEAVAGLRVADLALFVIDAVHGVRPQDEMLWREAARLAKPRMVFINKMDRDRASFDRTLTQIRERLGGAGFEPVELPVGEEADFHGVADLLTEHVWLYDSGRPEETTDLDESIAERERAEHDHLVEDVVEQDDQLLERYLDGDEPSAAELERALHAGVDRATVFPVLVGSAIGPNGPIGIDRLADFIVHVGPDPTEVPAPLVEVGGELVEIVCDPAREPLALVFKTVADPYVGQLSLFKVLSGVIEADDVLVNPRTGVDERMHGLVRVRGGSHEPIGRIGAGDIGAVTKLGDVETGDTLAPATMPVRLPGFDFPEPVHGVAIAARSRADEDKLAVALPKIVHEDPTVAVERNDETHQTVLRGMGDTHIQVTLQRIARRHGVDVVTAPVEVPHRETLSGPVEVQGRHKKQTGGRGQFGVVSMRFEPLPAGAGFEFVDEVVGGAVPRGLIPAVEKGVRESMERGGNHGFRVVDVRATLLDGKHHAVDSDEMSFKMAGALALSEAVRAAGTAVLEPISTILVVVPTDLQGDVMGDLTSRRGHVTGTEAGPGEGEATVTALVPTAEIVAYAIDLRSMTHGRGRFAVDHDHYEPMPGHVADRLVSP